MARDASPRTRTLGRALIALAAAGAALGAGATTASAAVSPALGVPDLTPGATDPQEGLRAVSGAVGHVTGPVTAARPNPLAGTGVDPLDNEVGTQVADFRPLNSRTLTGPVTQAHSVGSLPGATQVSRMVRS